MTDNDLRAFCNYYGVINIQMRDNRRRVSYTYGGYDNYSYYEPERDEVELELPRRGLEMLVDLDRRYDKVKDDRNFEHAMREKHPAIKDAYEKYKLLLELYR